MHIHFYINSNLTNKKLTDRTLISYSTEAATMFKILARYNTSLRLDFKIKKKIQNNNKSIYIFHDIFFIVTRNNINPHSTESRKNCARRAKLPRCVSKKFRGRVGDRYELVPRQQNWKRNRRGRETRIKK